MIDFVSVFERSENARYKIITPFFCALREKEGVVKNIVTTFLIFLQNHHPHLLLAAGEKRWGSSPALFTQSEKV